MIVRDMMYDDIDKGFGSLSADLAADGAAVHLGLAVQEHHEELHSVLHFLRLLAHLHNHTLTP